MKIKVEVEVPDGAYCNDCPFLETTEGCTKNYYYCNLFYETNELKNQKWPEINKLKVCIQQGEC